MTKREAEATIKAAAMDKMPSFYFEISEVDLIATDLQYHDACYSTFTHGYSKLFRNPSPTVNEQTSTFSTQEKEIQREGDYNLSKNTSTVTSLKISTPSP